jgi:hypothetical protein
MMPKSSGIDIVSFLHLLTESEIWVTKTHCNGDYIYHAQLLRMRTIEGACIKGIGLIRANP